jgi:hypothetical protein
MRRIAITLLLTAASAQAQVTCPVNLYAQRQSPVVIQSTSEAAKQDQSQALHVILKRTDTPPIVSVEATLYGLSPDAQVIPVAARRAREISKTFQLERKPGEASLTHFDLSMSRVGILKWVDVTSITYADGTSWHTPQASLCRAVPSPLVLVAGR